MPAIEANLTFRLTWTAAKNTTIQASKKGKTADGTQVKNETKQCRGSLTTDRTQVLQQMMERHEVTEYEIKDKGPPFKFWFLKVYVTEPHQCQPS